MNEQQIVTRSQKQIAVVALDSRLVECEFYRVSASKPGQHRSVIKLVRDAGANLNLSYFGDVAARLRLDFARQGWSYISDNMLNQLLRDGAVASEALAARLARR
jgi:hypothetical protein